MRLLSLILCILGGIGLAIALFMDTTVTTDAGVHVHNIGLVSDRQTYLFTAGILLVVGAVIFGFSTLRPIANQQSGIRSILPVVVVLLIGGLGAWVYLDRKSYVAPVAPVPPISSTSQPPDNSLRIDVEQFTVKLEGSDNYLQTAMVWSLGSSSDKALLQRFDPEIRYKVLLLLSSKSLSQVSGATAILKLAEEIRSTVNSIVGSKSAVKEVFFVTFITQ